MPLFFRSTISFHDRVRSNEKLDDSVVGRETDVRSQVARQKHA